MTVPEQEQMAQYFMNEEINTQMNKNIAQVRSGASWKERWETQREEVKLYLQMTMSCTQET